MCRAIEHQGLDPEEDAALTAMARNGTEEQPRLELRADDAELYYGNYTAFGIQCPDTGDRVFRAPVVIQMKLRGDEVHTRVAEEEWMGRELRNASLILGGSFINIIIKNEKTFGLINNATAFKNLINYTEAISIQYLIQAHINEEDDPAYTDFIWTINQNFDFQDRARVDLQVFFKFFPIKSTIISSQVLPQQLLSAFVSILSVALMTIEVKQIFTLNDLFAKIWKRYGQGAVLKRKMREDFNKALKDIFKKNRDQMKSENAGSVLSPANSRRGSNNLSMRSSISNWKQKLLASPGRRTSPKV